MSGGLCAGLAAVGIANTEPEVLMREWLGVAQTLLQRGAVVKQQEGSPVPTLLGSDDEFSWLACWLLMRGEAGDPEPYRTCVFVSGCTCPSVARFCPHILA